VSDPHRSAQAHGGRDRQIWMLEGEALPVTFAPECKDHAMESRFSVGSREFLNENDRARNMLGLVVTGLAVYTHGWCLDWRLIANGVGRHFSQHGL
jgi:hypothetical protein